MNNSQLNLTKIYFTMIVLILRSLMIVYKNMILNILSNGESLKSAGPLTILVERRDFPISNISYMFNLNRFFQQHSVVSCEYVFISIEHDEKPVVYFFFPIDVIHFLHMLQNFVCFVQYRQRNRQIKFCYVYKNFPML